MQTAQNPNAVLRIYFLAFAALLALTALTVYAAFLDFGRWNTLIALAIAAVKAVIVLLFFMHLLHSPLLVRAVIIAGIAWLILLGGITFSDYVYRFPLDRPDPGSWIGQNASHFSGTE